MPGNSCCVAKGIMNSFNRVYKKLEYNFDRGLIVKKVQEFFNIPML